MKLRKDGMPDMRTREGRAWWVDLWAKRYFEEYVRESGYCPYVGRPQVTVERVNLGLGMEAVPFFVRVLKTATETTV